MRCSSRQVGRPDRRRSTSTSTAQPTAVEHRRTADSDAATEAALVHPRLAVQCETYLHPVRPSVAFNLIDGLIRMTFFLIMIFSFSLLKDIRRVFQYHGAEHKTVFTWEAGLAADGRERAATTAPASALRHEFSDGGDAGVDRVVLGHQV